MSTPPPVFRALLGQNPHPRPPSVFAADPGVCSGPPLAGSWFGFLKQPLPYEIRSVYRAASPRPWLLAKYVRRFLYHLQNFTGKRQKKGKEEIRKERKMWKIRRYRKKKM